MSKLVLALYSPGHSERYAIKIKDDDYRTHATNTERFFIGEL